MTNEKQVLKHANLKQFNLIETIHSMIKMCLIMSCSDPLVVEIVEEVQGRLVPEPDKGAPRDLPQLLAHHVAD